MRRIILADLLVAIFVMVPATTTLSSAASPLDACSLLTPDQVSAELGATVQAGEHLVASASSLCAWAPAGGPKLGGDKVVLDIKTVQAFSLGKIPIKGATKTPVSGIGDDAYYITAGGLGTSLSVRKGDVAFNINLHGHFPIDEIKAKEKALALNVLPKL